MRSQSTDSSSEPAPRAVSNHLMTVSTALTPSIDSRDPSSLRSAP